MDNETNQFSTESVTPKLGDHVPDYIKKKFATAKKQPDEDMGNDPEKTEDAEVQEVEKQEPEKTEPNDSSDEIKAWKGRLQKEQSLRKQAEENAQSTTAQLQEFEQSRKQLEQKAKELEEKLNSVEKDKNNPEQDNGVQDKNPFTPELEEEILYSLGGGNAARTILDSLKSIHKQGSVPVHEFPDVNKVVAEKLEHHQQKTKAQQRDMQWFSAIQEQAPNIQGLLSDTAFQQFLNEKVVDFKGNTGIDLINEAGKARDIRYIPQIVSLIDEFNKENEPNNELTTEPPKSKGAVAKPRPTKTKPKMTASDEAKKHRLIMSGDRDAYEKFIAKFDY